MVKAKKATICTGKLGINVMLLHRSPKANVMAKVKAKPFRFSDIPYRGAKKMEAGSKAQKSRV